MKEIKKQNIILAILGIIILGLGIGMNAKVGIGVDSLSAAYTGFVKITGLSLGTITALANALFVIISIFLDKKNVGIATVLFIFISKWPVDFGEKYMVTSSNYLISIPLCILSILVLALGSELFVLSDLGADSYTSVGMGICKRINYKVKYVYIRYICDGFFLIVAFLTGGQIGIGTVLSLALIGNFMKMWQKIIVKLFKLETSSKIQ